MNDNSLFEMAPLRFRSLETIRIYITENCNSNCKNCFNKGLRTEKEIPPIIFEELCKWLSSNNISKLKIMGGEPTVHTEFEKIFEISTKYFDKLFVFTNGRLDKFHNLNWRDNDTLVFNFNFNKFFNEQTLCVDRSFFKRFEVQVTAYANERKILKRLLELCSLDREKMNVSLTLDCTENIFIKRDVLLKKLEYIEQGLLDNGIEPMFDHHIPFCFLFDSKVKVNSYPICFPERAGLIDSSLNLRFCNQYQMPLLKLYSAGKFIPWYKVLNKLLEQFMKLQIKALENGCINCQFWNVNCNGGCWMFKDIFLDCKIPSVNI